MRLAIDMPEDVYTRLFDNGIQDNEIAVDDVCEMARAIRNGTLLQKWTLASEKLPENNGRYLAYIVNEHNDKLQYIMTCDYVIDNHWFSDDECASDNVIAWMPLPKPYKAESEG